MNIEDREFLELASKAAGYRIREYSPGTLHCDRGKKDGASMIWNPLTDDGDAFRLFVALKIDVLIYMGEVEAIATFQPSGRNGVRPFGLEVLSPDPAAATRRAIVRAAAEIGRRMA